jgi:hypothetical protein
LAKNYKDSISRLSETKHELEEKLKTKDSVLEEYVSRLQDYLADVKVQHKTGEMDEDTFKAANDCILAEIGFAEAERKEILQNIQSLVP